MIRPVRSRLRSAEFVPLIAFLMSLVALSVDAMLPALPAIGRDLGVQHENDAQFVITSLFVGLGLGQLLFGPLSDRIGRKLAIIVGLMLFMAGCVISLVATSFDAMIAGRVLQGIGAASPRVVTMALVRDQFSGQQMAKLMSFVMAIFILVPAVAPLLGQTILLFGDWRAIFATFLAMAAIVFAWFAIRQPETLAVEKRLPFSVGSISNSLGVIVRTRPSLGYALATGLVFSPFVTYLSTAQQIFQVTYDTGALFPVYFGILALAIGAGSVANDRLLNRWSMHQISSTAAFAVAVVSTVAFLAFVPFDGLPPFWLYLGYLGVVFLCMGTLFGNLNALAMEPLGHVAGVGAALVSSLATFVAVAFGGVIGQFFDGTVIVQVGAFALFSLATLAAMQWGIHSGYRQNKS